MENTNNENNTASKGTNRRVFIKTAAAGAAIAALGAGGYYAIENYDKDKDRVVMSKEIEGNTIPKRLLGNTGLEVSLLGMGQAVEPGLYSKGFRAGLNLIETARKYMGGNHERIVGKGLKQIDRKKVVIVTKFDAVNDYRGIMESAEESLSALGTDYIDVLLGHGVNDPKLMAGSDYKKAFLELKRKGKIRFCGISTHRLKPTVEWIIENGFYDVALVGFNYASGEEAEAVLERAQKKGIGIIGMKSLSFKFRNRSTTIPPALRYVSSRPYISSIVVPMQNASHLSDNYFSIQKPYTAGDKELLSKNTWGSHGNFI